MTAHTREDQGRVEGALIGLAFAFFALAGSQGESRPVLVYAALLLWPLVAAGVWLGRRSWPAIAYLVALGVLIRLAYLAPRVMGSDVLTVTAEALGVLLRGGNPYTHAYASVPQAAQASGFSYPPGNLLYYLPGFLAGDIRATEIASAALVLAGLAAVGWLTRSRWTAAAVAVYAAAPPLVALATDNSNDTSAGALLFAALVALLLARRRSSAGGLVLAGILMGWAITFKQYALAFWPFAVGYLATQDWRLRRGRAGAMPAWLAYAAVSAGVCALLILPFFVRSPGAFLASMLVSQSAFHPIAGWNLWAVLGLWQGWDADRWLGPALAAVPLAAVFAVTALGLRAGLRTPGRAVVFGVLSWCALLFLSRWTTYAYFAGIAPAVCLLPFADDLAEGPAPAAEGEAS
jgi:hypothetical protein